MRPCVFFVSLLVVLHLTAMFVAPWNRATKAALPPEYSGTGTMGRSVALPPTDDPRWQQPRLVRSLARFFHHYQNLVYPNHGYESLEADPVGTHLVEYRVTQDDGTYFEAHFPDPKEQWPRLLYHRYTMLAEQVDGIGLRAIKNYAEHLAQAHGGRVHLNWIVHHLLSPQQVIDGMNLGDQSTYRSLRTIDATAPQPGIQIPQGDTIAIPGGVR